MVFFPFNKCMCSITIGFYAWKDDLAILILEFFRRMDWYSSILNRIIINCLRVFNSEGYIFDSISMFNQMFVHLFAWILLINRAKNKGCTFLVSDHMLDDFSLPCFKSLVRKIFKPKPRCIIGSSLLGVTNPKRYVISVKEKITEPQYLSIRWS